MSRISVQEQLDAFGRRHPRCMMLVVLLLAITVTLILLHRDEAPGILYQNF